MAKSLGGLLQCAVTDAQPAPEGERWNDEGIARGEVTGMSEPQR